VTTETNKLNLEAENMARMLQEAFQSVDPECKHRFDWADFGPYSPTDRGLDLAKSLVAALASQESAQ